MPRKEAIRHGDPIAQIRESHANQSQTAHDHDNPAG
ncbi:hypothetical protein SAMN05216264_102189 [Pseudomonas marincola]|nr:hypothetical protein SAMN05216264_102189 [Pseudomonas marincola]